MASAFDFTIQKDQLNNSTRPDNNELKADDNKAGVEWKWIYSFVMVAWQLIKGDRKAPRLEPKGQRPRCVTVGGPLMIVFKINKNLNERLSIPWLMNAIFVSIIYATVFVVNCGIGLVCLCVSLSLYCFILLFLVI